jgi:two-component system chemotaxis response regulator CheY
MRGQALVIDDSSAVRMILSKMLMELGFEVVQAGDGQAALDTLRGLANPTIALVDWNMPEMNGYEFVRAVRALPAYDDVILMMVTSEKEVEQVVMALEAGANEYVMKPFTKDVILGKLEILGLVETVG